MKIAIILCLIAVFLSFLYLLSIKGRKGYCDFSGFKKYYFAHRGLFGNGVPENSLLAFKLAKEGGYGAEFDVHLLADGELAVIHDHSLLRTTGFDIAIEDLKSSDLEKFRLEDTDETIPSLDSVLEIFGGERPLIIELKAKNNVDKLCKAVAEKLKNYKGEYCIESFNPRCIYWFKKYEPDFIRGQLSENYFKNDKSTLSIPLKFIMSFLMTNFLTKPDFVAYRYADRKHIANRLCVGVWKMQNVGWTIVSKEDIIQADKEDMISIFEKIKP